MLKRVFCIKDVYWTSIRNKGSMDNYESVKIYESGKIYDVNKDFGSSLSISLKHLKSGFRFYYRGFGFDNDLLYNDHFVSLEDYRELKLQELGI
jgi:hypothetical protein